MKTPLTSVVALLLLGAPLGAQTAAPEPEETEKTTSGELQLGIWNSDLSGSPDIVSKYAPAGKTNGLGRLTLKSHPTWGNVDLNIDWQDSLNQRHYLDFDVHRVLRSHTSYVRFPARLGHDPLTYVEAVTTHGRVLRYTDTDPGAAYELKDGILEHRTEIQPSGLGALTVGFNFRDQRRKGAHQALTVSHCDNCHVTSQTRPIDETQQDIGFDAKVAWMTGYLKGAYTHRTLREDVTSIDLLYDRARHPESQLPIFDNRVQYDSLDGPLPVDILQDTDKNIYKVDLQQTVASFFVTGTGVWSDTTNKYANTEADYQGYFLTAARSFVDNRLRFRLRGRYYQTDTDDYFYDTVERISVAGPQVGRTYRDVYGLDVDYLRQSALNRDVWQANADLTYKLGRRAGSVNASWSLEDIEREYYEVAPGVTKTTTNVLGLAWRPRPARGLRFTADYRHAFVDNPYMLVNGACSNQVTEGPLASPFDPRAVQYYVMRGARIADTTASASGWDDLRLRGSYTRKGASISAMYRFWDGQNEDGDLTDWSRTNQTATLTLSVVPSPTWDGYLTYNWQDLQNDSPVCIAVFDG